jgi:hypothetical protein
MPGEQRKRGQLGAPQQKNPARELPLGNGRRFVGFRHRLNLLLCRLVKPDGCERSAGSSKGSALSMSF